MYIVLCFVLHYHRLPKVVANLWPVSELILYYYIIRVTTGDEFVLFLNF